MSEAKEVKVTYSGLTPDTKYIGRVRTFDKLGNPSGWTDAIAFTTPRLDEEDVPVQEDNDGNTLLRGLSFNKKPLLIMHRDVGGWEAWDGVAVADGAWVPVSLSDVDAENFIYVGEDYVAPVNASGTKYYPQRAGWWRCSMTVHFTHYPSAASGTGDIINTPYVAAIAVQRNGGGEADFRLVSRGETSGFGLDLGLNGSEEFYFNGTTNYIEFLVKHEAGSSRRIKFPKMCMEWISD